MATNLNLSLCVEACDRTHMSKVFVCLMTMCIDKSLLFVFWKTVKNIGRYDCSSDRMHQLSGRLNKTAILFTGDPPITQT